MEGICRSLQFLLIICIFQSIIIIGVASADVEPNNTIFEAEDAVEGTMYRGVVSLDPLDVDYYDFNFTPNKLVKVELYYEGGSGDGNITLTNIGYVGIAGYFGEKGNKINISVNTENLFSTKTVDTENNNPPDITHILIEGEGFYRFKTLYGERVPGSDGGCGMALGSGLFLSLVILFIPVFSSRNKNRGK